MSFPRTIYILRHGEKPDDKEIPDLTIQGVARAYYLPKHWQTEGYAKPDVIFCFRNAHGTQNRSVELMTPFCHENAIPMNVDFAENADEDKLVAHVMTQTTGKTVLICWEHNNIPKIVAGIFEILSQSLGVKNSMKDKFRFWALDPTNGKGGQNDGHLYALTLRIDTSSLELKGMSQSTNFVNQVLLLETPTTVLFELD
jgi:hypothetical protein